MSDPVQDVHSQLKDNKELTVTMNPDEEISLDGFFQMAGMDSSQLEALYCPLSPVAVCAPDEGHINISEKNSPFINQLQSTDTEETINHIKARYEAEISNYKKKLSSYQDGQQKQAQLIQKLQAKLQTTTETLNARIDVAETRARALEQERSFDIENTVNKLHEEQQRSNELSRANELLRDQLEQAVQANQGLSQDVARLTLAWRHAAQQLDKRESEWREEESAFNDYFAAEHNRLLSLWRAVVALRRQFADLRQQTDKDLTNTRTEFSRYIGNIQSACNNLEANLRAAEVQNQASQAKTANFLESDMTNRIQGLTESLARSQARLTEAETKLTEAMTAKERLAIQLAERDRILTTMKQLHSNYEVNSQSRRSSNTFKRGKRIHDVLDKVIDNGKQRDGLSELEPSTDDEDDHLKATKRLIEHTHVMHHALSQIAQLVIWDATIADTDEAQDPILNLKNPDWSTTRVNLYSDKLKPAVSDPSVDTKTQIVLQNEGDDINQLESKIHFSKPEEISSLRQLAHSKYQAGSSLHLAESTVNAVQSALNRRATHVHRLRLRSSGMKEQVNNLLRRGEEADIERKRLSEQLARLREELETQSLEMDKLSRERDKIKQTLSLTKEEHEISESARQNLNEHVREIESELERLKTSLHDMRKQRDDTISERDRLQTEQERTLRELDAIQKTLSSTEQRAVNLREELATIREHLRRVELEKEILDQEKNDAITTASRIQEKIEELSGDLNQAYNRENQYKSKIARLETVLESQEHDAEQLSHQISLTHANENRLTEERANLRMELQEQRDELEKLYSEKLLTQSELEQARESTMRAETARTRLEAELSELARERMTLTESLSETQRQKATLMEDISTFRRDSERQEALIMRITNEKEAISRHKAELLLQLSIIERDNRHLTEIINNLKSEKESLESNLFDLQQTIEQLYHKQSQLERDVSELKSRRDELQAELCRAHSNFQIELEKSQRCGKEVGDQLSNELEGMRMALLHAERRAEEAENACLQAVARADQAVSVIDKQHQQHVDVEQLLDRELELRNSAEEMNRLTKELLAAQRERDEARLLAEQERQRALSRTAEEKVSLQEKVNALQETITELQTTLDRTQKDASAREDQERSALRKATEEVRSFRNQLQEACSQHERENRELRMRIHSLESQREQWTKEVSELQLQIRMAEEVRDTNRTELVDSTYRIRALEETNDSSRRECSELRQRLGELEREKTALDHSNEELRKQLKSVELERVDLVRMTNSLKSKLQGTEMDRTSSERRVADLQVGLKEATNLANEAKREIIELRNKLQRTESEKAKLSEEIEDLKVRLKESINQEENLKREKVALKQKLLEIEASNPHFNRNCLI
ncbi:unnamed protein product [Heterobilharzia americana]|nr:unnamed protein product [Heterobilharzia americana]